MDNTYSAIEYETKTVILEENENFVRIRTMCSDQNYVRAYYFSQIDEHKSITVMSYLVDIMLDMSLLMQETLNDQMILTTKQRDSLNKLKLYSDNLSMLNLDNNIWELDWMIKTKQESIPTLIEFFKKRTELELGAALPIYEE